MQISAYDALTARIVWRFEEACAPGSRGPGLITGSGLPVTFRGEDCMVFHGNRQWKILRLADGKQVWSWECTGPQEAPAWANGGLRPVGKNLHLDALNGWCMPVISRGRLFVRTPVEIICYDIRDRAAGSCMTRHDSRSNRPALSVCET